MASQKVRTSLSKKSKYYISKNRRLELKYFCLQYKEWKEYLKEYYLRYGTSEFSDPTAEEAMLRTIYISNIDLVTQISKIAGGEISEYLFKAVTEDLSFVNLKTVLNIPCSKDYYYERYHKFWYLLSQKEHMF